MPSTLSGLPVTVSFPVAEAALVGSSLEPDRAVHHVVRAIPARSGMIPQGEHVFVYRGEDSRTDVTAPP